MQLACLELKGIINIPPPTTVYLQNDPENKATVDRNTECCVKNVHSKMLSP